MSDFVSGLVRTSANRKSGGSKSKAAKKSEQTTAGGAGVTPEQLKIAKDYLVRQGLFDTDYYASTYGDVAKSGVDPFEHFFLHGFLEGRRPNVLFDTAWYIATNPDVTSSRVNPLLHYARIGEPAGTRPNPHFDPAWYRTTYGLTPNESPLGHYLANRKGAYSPIPEFDAQYYLSTYPDIRDAGVDPFEHFMSYGFKEGRNPSGEFDVRFYVQRYLGGKFDQNPLAHFLEHREEKGVYSKPPLNEATIPAEIRRFTRSGPHFEELQPLPPRAKRRAKVLAYYLTQFHSFPENDKWWGKGFTEWTNIARGVPRFKDHYQPRVPRDLGFYTLEDINTMRKQVELARGSGIDGFVFYYYWFNGKRLLERPLEQFLKTRDIDMPFCLMWANENWTRRWDGMEGEVLISQDYLAEDDELLLADYARHFSDPRYIRIDGRPLLMVYRPGIIPNAKEVIERWRQIFAEKFDEGPIIVMSQSFDDFDPGVYGLDGAIEFPPHKITKFTPRINNEVELFDDTFNGQVYRYEDVVDYSLKEPRSDFPLIKTIVPSWDNDARRQGSGLVIQGSTPAKYEAWLSALIERAQTETFFGEKIICVNAWNEWCEGAYLEPDLHFGSAYLNATARAVAGIQRDATMPKLLLVGHDAFPSGAQHLLLHIGKTLKSAFNVDIRFLLMGGGKLEADYAQTAPVTIVRSPNELPGKLAELCDQGVTAAIVNTSASGSVVPVLTGRGIRTISLIHELPRILREKGLEEQARRSITTSHKVVFASRYVRDSLVTGLKLDEDKSDRFVIFPQGSYKQIEAAPDKAEQLRYELGIPAGAPVVLGVGYADLRKGFDLFLQVWRLAHLNNPGVHFVWVGDHDPGMMEWLAGEVATAEATKTFHLIGFRSDMETFYSAASVLALTSREDPFPTVALEAVGIGVPVVAFANSGGIPEFLKENQLGRVVDYCDTAAMARAIGELIRMPVASAERDRMMDLIEQDFSFPNYVKGLLELAAPTLPAVSVAVPNYNYAHCLRERLDTIFDQTHPVDEILVLDDASTDSSVDVIMEVAESRQRDLALIINEENSGSVFAQWTKAAEMASGEFLWIAEADDQSDPQFLARLVGIMKADPSIALAFSDSRSIDAEGREVYASYKPYYASIAPEALSRSEVFNGSDFVARYLAVKNTILNVSSVVWRREALLAALEACRDELKDFRMAGDWRLYLQALIPAGAKIAYVADPLNVHRRHAESVTHSLKAEKHVAEIAAMHAAIRGAVKLPKKQALAQAAYVDEVTGQLMGPAEPPHQARPANGTAQSVEAVIAPDEASGHQTAKSGAPPRRPARKAKKVDGKAKAGPSPKIGPRRKTRDQASQPPVSKQGRPRPSTAPFSNKSATPD
ncbi:MULTISPECIES: glycoside hydrolase family 99-like domain-containing protein [Bradyrhizobium]|uniref:glycoside hydrolase family 99-like domain-containing protein n=1 Tax=Bradyrhizobium TaxID=374 RepID=UPI001EDACE89|nr:glycoside hydrolase family 99-like domain-containing protein [Bradyrhizobium zhengyangense]MCG2643805.1 glycoside hydrolase family 99-like domain-containing protein [Bradyrhizobium zhengyangense]